MDGERFWCKVLQKRLDEMLLATVENRLQLNSLRLGEQVVLRPCHVLETADLQDLIVFKQLTSAIGLQGGAGACGERRASLGEWASRPNQIMCSYHPRCELKMTVIPSEQ